MMFAGWTFAQLAALFGVGAAIITGLYLLRMQRRQVVVPFAALWQEVARQTDSRKLWRRLRRVGSWLLQLLVLALLCLALGDPRPSAWLREPVHLAIVIDISASMGAPVDGAARTRLDLARQRAAALVGELGPVDDALVVAAAPNVRIVAPRTSDRSVLAEAIEGLAPVPGEVDLAGALALARSAVSSTPGGKIVVLTDGAYGDANKAAFDLCRAGSLPCERQRVGAPADNVAITAFAARRYPNAPEKVEVLTEVRNLGETAIQVVLDVEAEGTSLGRKTLSLAPGAAQREVLSDLDAARPQLVARLSSTSSVRLPGIAIDDVAHAIIPPLRPLDVVLVSDGTNLFLDAALLTSGDQIRLQGATPAQAVEDPSVFEGADVVLFDVAEAPLPATLPPAHRVIFDPWRGEQSPSPVALRRRVTRPFLTEQNTTHPMLADVVLKDVNVARGTTFDTKPGDVVLVRSLGEPLIVLHEDTFDTVLIGFDPRQSDLPLRPAFPLLIHNILRAFEQRSPGFVASLRVADRQTLALDELGVTGTGVSEIEVSTPDGQRAVVSATDGRFEFAATQQGLYTFTPRDGDAAGSTSTVAVNQADAGASDLRVRHEGDTDDEIEGLDDASPTGLGEGPLWSLIVLIMAGLVALEWATYHRRLTV